jgi:enamine deaminase RidA (YjgF/YER057c/UK114 family)
MSIDEKLLALGITLPSAAAPAAAYVMYAQSGNQVFLSGHIAKKDGKPWVGQLGRDLGTEQGRDAARAVAIDLLATLKAACGGDLGRVRRIVKVMSLVNSTPDLHRAAPGHQRRIRAAGRGLRRRRPSCAVRLWRRPDSAGRLR